MTRLFARRLASVGIGLAVIAAAAEGAGCSRVSAKQDTSGWKLVLDRPFTGKYEDMSWPDSKHGWLISAAGDILHSEDGGLTWALQANRRGPGMRSIDFIDDKRGFAGTLGGTLFGTTDGGITWNDITSTLPHQARGYCGMTHVGEHMYIVGRYMGPADYFFSPDGGKTWQYSDLTSLAQGLVDISFVSESVGFIGGMAPIRPDGPPPTQGPATLLKTTDGGKSWHTVFTHDGGRGFVWKVFPINAKLIYASLQSQDGTYRVIKSTDGGDKWDVLVVTTSGRQSPGVQGIGFLDANHGWIGGFFKGMWTTTDGGKTWAEVPRDDGTFNRFERVGNTLITAGTAGVLRYEGK